MYVLNRCEKQRVWFEKKIYNWMDGGRTLYYFKSARHVSLCDVKHSFLNGFFLHFQSFSISSLYLSNCNQATNSCSQCSLIGWNVMMAINQFTFHCIFFRLGFVVFSFDSFSIPELQAKCFFRLIYVQLLQWVKYIPLFHGN